MKCSRLLSVCICPSLPPSLSSPHPLHHHLNMSETKKISIQKGAIVYLALAGYVCLYLFCPWCMLGIHVWVCLGRVRYQLKKLKGPFQRAYGIQIGARMVRVSHLLSSITCSINCTDQSVLCTVARHDTDQSMFCTVARHDTDQSVLCTVTRHDTDQSMFCFQNPHDIIFMCDLHLKIPNNMINIIRKVSQSVR